MTKFKLLFPFHSKIYCLLTYSVVLILVLQPVKSLFPSTCATETCRFFEANRERKQQDRIRILKGLRENFSPRNVDLTLGDLPFQELISRLQTRKLSAVQVLSAFIGRAVNATDEFNCVTEFVPDAMKMAVELDALPNIKGPLHGVPFCVKDDHDIKGMDTTLGYSRNLFKPANETATIVKIFQDLGAIPFCKTNVPQTLLSFGSDNPIFGTTLNPLNKLLSPGGSSSGSACLVGSKAIPFATGTDSAGSGRVPSHFTGISSIMPTSRRLSTKGIRFSIPTVTGINVVPVIFAENPSTLAFLFKALTENNIQYLNDHSTVPITWKSELFEEKRPLRYGYVSSIPFFPAMGDTPSVIERTKERLEKLGHTVVPFHFEWPDAYRYMKLFSDISFADGGQYIASQIKDDKVSTAFRPLNFVRNIPPWTKRIAGALPLPARLQIVLGAGLDAGSSIGLQGAIDAGRDISRQILQKMKEKNLDLLLSPVFPVPALRLQDAPNLFLASCYVVLWNLLDFPAGVVRMGFESGRNINAVDTRGDLFLGLAKANLKHAVGMPIGVQIVGKPFNEELILRSLNELEGDKSL